MGKGMARIQSSDARRRADDLRKTRPAVSARLAPAICGKQLESTMVSLNQKGFALLVVLWAVAIISAVSLTLVAGSRAEARKAAADWEELAARRLAHSGQEVARYMKTRGFGVPNENLSGVPIEARVSGFRYTIHFPEGDIELLLESDDGKISATTTD